MVDVFGPASPLIDLKAFTAQAQSRISDYLPDAGGSARFQAMTDQQRSWMLNRLDCSDLRQTADTVFAAPQRVVELSLWQRARYLAGSDDPVVLAAMQEKILGNAKVPATPAAMKARPNKGKKKAEADDQIDPTLQPDEHELPEALQLETPAETFRQPRPTVARAPMPQAETPVRPTDDHVPSGLEIYDAFPEAQHYVRWTRKADLNTLLSVRPHGRALATEAGLTNEQISAGRIRNDDPGPPLQSPLLLLTITLHPLIAAKFTARQQRIVILSSQTLADLRDAIVCPVDALPAERAAPTVTANGGRTQRYEARPFDGGALFLIEGVVYSDARPGKSDLGRFLQAQIAHADWSDARPKHLGAEVDGPPAHTYHPHGMQAVQLGDLALRLDHPYWLYHQGSCEHVFTIDDVRLAHPADRVPLDGPACPYPLTTLLSRLGADKCRICNRDPATKILIDDELAGETPALCCDVCFHYMHGDGGDLSADADERARQAATAMTTATTAGVECIPILESMGMR